MAPGYNVDRYRAFRRWLYEQKDKPCEDCGRRFPACAMDFDHREGGKAFSVAHGNGRPREAVLAEIAKCDLVCANCHRVRTKLREYVRRYPDGAIPVAARRYMPRYFAVAA